jgi:hypothetical protein
MSTARATFHADGFLPEAMALARPEAATAALDDTPLFDAELARHAQAGRRQVPYMLTDAIRRLALDSAVTAVAQDLLQTDRWVMWGANIRRSVPNEAQLWHADLESVLWPSITVAIGLSGCQSEGATCFIPGSQAIGRGPATLLRDCADTQSVVQRAQQHAPACAAPRSVAGFGDGRFYVFNGRCWHRANELGAAGKVVLYLHYQAADDKRIPLMLDYARHLWSRQACPYMVSPGAGAVREAVYAPPLRHRLKSWFAGRGASDR